MHSLPVVDVSGLPDPLEQQRVAIELDKATRQCGFFYIAGHQIEPAAVESIRQAQRKFFQLEPSVKSRFAINQYNRGYLGEGKARMHGSKTHDQKEVFFWGAELANNHPDVVDKIPLCGPNQWPDQPSMFKQAVMDYSNAVEQIGNNLLACIALSLNAKANFFRQHYQQPMLRGQLIRYPKTIGGESDFGVAAHTDFGCITILLQETPGLEVMVKGQWIDAPPIKDTFVINVGDLLERWSDRKLPSTCHRVKNKNAGKRYSIAMFHDPSPRAIIDPRDLNPDVEDGQYEPVEAAYYIHSRNKGAFSHYGKVAPINS